MVAHSSSRRNYGDLKANGSYALEVDIRFGRERQAFDYQLQKLKRTSSYSQDEKNALHVSLSTSREKLMNDFARRNMGLVYSAVLKGQRKYGVLLDDDELMSLATVAFTRSLMKYDPERGCKFSTYSLMAMENAMRREAGKIALQRKRIPMECRETATFLDRHEASSLEEDEMREEDSIVAQGLLSLLSDREQEILRLRTRTSDKRGFGYEKMAASQGRSREGVRKVAWNAVTKLKNMVRGYSSSLAENRTA